MAPKRRPVIAASSSMPANTSSVSSASPANLASSSNSSSTILQTRAQMKYNTRSNSNASKGTKPTSEPVSISEMFFSIILHICNKITFLDIKFRLGGYVFMLFFVSIVADYSPFPKSYFSSSKNIPNQYFVKWSWAWTLLFVGTFIYITSSVYCCMNRKRTMRHLSRLLIGTIIWFVWTNFFRIIEEATGQCTFKDASISTLAIKNRKSCLIKEGKWRSYDISGHCFLLIFCVLLMIEETKVIIGWDNIKTLIRNEEYRRNQRQITSDTETYLSSLDDEDYSKLKKSYGQFGSLAKVYYFFLTLLILLCDSMILATCCYFHTMIEKVLGGLIAIIMWKIIYYGLYTFNFSIFPELPGKGTFKYMSGVKPSISAAAATNLTSNLKGTSSNKTSSKEIPKFMGMPLYSLQKDKNKDSDGGGDEELEGPSSYISGDFSPRNLKN